MNPTTALVNFYKEGAKFKWHRDSEDPAHARHDTGPPIVSFTADSRRIFRTRTGSKTLNIAPFD